VRLAGRRQRVLAIGAVLHTDHGVGAVPEREPFEDLNAPRPIGLRQPQADDDIVAAVDELKRLEPASLLIEVCEAADDLPSATSGGRLRDLGFVDGPPYNGGIEEADPWRQLAAPKGLVRVPNHHVPASHQPHILPSCGHLLGTVGGDRTEARRRVNSDATGADRPGQ